MSTSSQRGIGVHCRDFARFAYRPQAKERMRALDHRNKASKGRDNRLEIGLTKLRIPKSETTVVKLTVIGLWALRPIIFGLAAALISGC